MMMTSASTTNNSMLMMVRIGRGRAIRENPGNVRFMSIVQSFLGRYQDAPTKAKKSVIIQEIFDAVKSEHDAHFVRYENATGACTEVNDTIARFTIAQTLRDALSDSYKSSKQNKQRLRWARKTKGSGGSASSGSTRSSVPSKIQEKARALQVKDTGSVDAVLKSFSYVTDSKDMMKGSNAICEGTWFFSGIASTNNSLKEMMRNTMATTRQAQLFCSYPQLPMDALQLPERFDDELDLEEEHCHQEEIKDDVFSSLFEAFAPASTLDDPFEPKPISEAANATHVVDQYDPLECIPITEIALPANFIF